MEFRRVWGIGRSRQRGGEHRQGKAAQASWTTQPPSWEHRSRSKSEFPRPQPFSCFHENLCTR